MLNGDIETCSLCESERITKKGRIRKLTIQNSLFPNIFLKGFNEDGVDTTALYQEYDAILVIGTKLEIRTLRRLVRDIQRLNDCPVYFVNPQSPGFSDIANLQHIEMRWETFVELFSNDVDVQEGSELVPDSALILRNSQEYPVNPFGVSLTSRNQIDTDNTLVERQEIFFTQKAVKHGFIDDTVSSGIEENISSNIAYIDKENSDRHPMSISKSRVSESSERNIQYDDYPDVVQPDNEDPVIPFESSAWPESLSENDLESSDNVIGSDVSEEYYRPKLLDPFTLATSHHMVEGVAVKHGFIDDTVSSGIEENISSNIAYIDKENSDRHPMSNSMSIVSESSERNIQYDDYPDVVHSDNEDHLVPMASFDGGNGPTNILPVIEIPR
jgi:hypothetical protein